MNVAACLLLFGLILAWLAPPLLIRLTRSGAAPGIGAAAWLTAIGTVLVSWTAAVVFLLVDVAGGGSGRSLLDSCMSRLRGVVTGHAGVVWQAGSIAFAIAALVAAVLIGRRVVQGVLRLRSVSGGHARAARIVGRAATERPDVVILEAPERAAYCVAGRPHAIVVTSAALGVLDPAQLDAVLAHERAHLTGWHPQILAALRALAASLPRIPLFTVGCAEVARLLEMCADDAAAVRHGRRTLLSGLIALVGDPAVPAPAVGATSTAVLARAVRLASPPPSAVRARSRLVLAATIAVIAAAPAVAGLLAASGVLLCDLTAM